MRELSSWLVQGGERQQRERRGAISRFLGSDLRARCALDFRIERTFFGCDFISVFRRHFYDAISVVCIGLLLQSRFLRRYFDDGNRGQNPDRKSAAGSAKTGKKRPKLTEKIESKRARAPM